MQVSMTEARRGSQRHFGIWLAAGLCLCACLVMRPDGSLWAAAKAGPIPLYAEVWQVHPGAIACAPDGSLWLGTSKGVVHWDPVVE